MLRTQINEYTSSETHTHTQTLTNHTIWPNEFIAYTVLYDRHNYTSTIYIYTIRSEELKFQLGLAQPCIFIIAFPHFNFTFRFVNVIEFAFCFCVRVILFILVGVWFFSSLVLFLSCSLLWRISFIHQSFLFSISVVWLILFVCCS